VVVGGLGSPALVGAAQDLAERHRSPLTAATFTDLPNWDVFGNGTSADVVWGIVLKLTVLFVVVGLLTALAGRASRRAAFLAGWVSLVVAAGIAGAVHYAYRDAVVGTDGGPFQLSYLDNLLSAANNGAAFGLWTGWLVGAAVAITAALPARAALRPGVATGPIARSPGHPAITPPAPWWAADASPLSPIRYGSASVFASGFPSGASQDEDVAEGARGDVDLNSTLATPLARLGDDANATRPIPAASAANQEAADGTATDPTVVEPTVGDPTASGPTASDPPVIDPTIVKPAVADQG
jgi:hypothetical protein